MGASAGRARRRARRRGRAAGVLAALWALRRAARGGGGGVAVGAAAAMGWVLAKAWSARDGSDETWEAALFGWLVGVGGRGVDDAPAKDNLLSRAARRAELALAGRICSGRTDDLRNLLGRLPLWVTFPDFETCRWANRAFVKIWPRYKRLLAAEIKHHAELHVNRKLPEGIAEFRFDALDLGSAPPEVSAIKSYEGGGASEIIIDLEVRWLSNAAAVLAVRLAGGAVTLPVEVTEVSFLGLVRIALRPLRDNWLFFETVSVSLLPSPELDFALRLLGGGDVRAIPGFHEALEEMLRRRALSALTWPRAVGASLSARARNAAAAARAAQRGRAGSISGGTPSITTPHRMGGGIGGIGAGAGLLSGTEDEALAHPLLRRCCSGIVLVRLLSAKGLRGHSWWLWLTGSAPDSCVSFEVQGEGAAPLRSEVRSNSANPRWGDGKGAEAGERFELLVGDPVTQAVRLRVLNTARTLNYLTGGQLSGGGGSTSAASAAGLAFPSEEVIGEALVPISRVTLAQADRQGFAEQAWGTGLDAVVPLGEGNGSLHVCLQYFPLHPFGYQPRTPAPPSIAKSALKAPAPARRQRRRVRIATEDTAELNEGPTAAGTPAPAPAPAPAVAGVASTPADGVPSALMTPAATLKGVSTPAPAQPGGDEVAEAAPGAAGPLSPALAASGAAAAASAAAAAPPPVEFTSLAIHPPAGVLTVLVHAARHLPSRHEWASAGDPYVELTVGRQRRRGATRRRTHHPTWGEVFELVIHERPDELHGELTLEVWSKDALLPDCVLGTAAIPLADVRRGAASGRRWWPLDLESTTARGVEESAEGTDEAQMGGAAAIDVTLLWRLAVAPPMPPPPTATALPREDTTIAAVVGRVARSLEMARSKLTPSQQQLEKEKIEKEGEAKAKAGSDAAADGRIEAGGEGGGARDGGGGALGHVVGFAAGGIGAAGRGVAGLVSMPFRRRWRRAAAAVAAAETLAATAAAVDDVQAAPAPEVESPPHSQSSAKAPS